MARRILDKLDALETARFGSTQITVTAREQRIHNLALYLRMISQGKEEDLLEMLKQ